MAKKNIIRVICAVLIVCFAVCGLSACGGKSDEDTVKVTINDGGKKTEVEIESGKTVADALKEAKITLGENDECKPAKDEKLTKDTEVTVTRNAGGQKVSLTADGKTTDITTTAATVQALLDEQKITLGKDDEISEKLDAKITEGMKIVIKRVTYKTETKTEEIDFETKEENSSSLAEGDKEVTQEGVKGEKEVTYTVKYVDGKEVSREKTDEKVTKEPVDEIVSVGTYTDDGGDDSGYDGGDDSGDDSGNDGGDDGGDDEVYVVSKQPMPDCDEDGHGTYIVTYSDGSVREEVY